MKPRLHPGGKKERRKKRKISPSIIFLLPQTHVGFLSAGQGLPEGAESLGLGRSEVPRGEDLPRAKPVSVEGPKEMPPRVKMADVARLWSWEALAGQRHGGNVGGDTDGEGRIPLQAICSLSSLCLVGSRSGLVKWDPEAGCRSGMQKWDPQAGC